jgi:serine/threonine protein kinase/Tfp pilus assembly protein PilF
MALQQGSRLGPYEILAPIGAGGMGEVYRARDPRLGRDVAIKVLADAARHDSGRLQRFEREARAVAALSHPNVLAIFDIGAGEPPFLVTELLAGETLRALIDRGPLAPQRTMHLTLQLAAGLSAAHARGIVHRDLKPENVFITGDGHVKILDFGVARFSEPLDADRTGTSEPTLPGTVMGTPGYMAPEQLRGYDADARADIFALGAVVFEMLIGERAFRRATPADTISAVLNESPLTQRVVEALPPGLVAIVRRCLEKDPRDRFQSASGMAAAIESLSDVRPGAAGVRLAMPATASIAVLPFANLSADADNQYFSDGLADELINALTRLPNLRVASRTSSFRFRAPDADVREIGRELNVGAILEGSVRRAGPRVRITAHLTNAADGYHIWSERYDREMADVFDIQDDIVASIVGALTPALIGDTRVAARRPTENLQAYELYLRGRHYWNQRSPAVVGAAIRYFEEAIALDPEYAPAYAGLADCYSILHVYGWTPAEHSRPRALDAVTQALRLAPDLAEAHLAKAIYTFHFEQGWRSARRHFADALALNPRLAVVEAYFAQLLAAEYAYAEAQERLARALALDPHSSMVHFLAASAACVMGDMGAAETHAARALQLQPDSLGARWPTTVALIATGRYDEALAGGAEVMARTRAPIYVGVLGMLYGCAGRREEAEQLLQELDERQGRGEYIVPVARLSVHLGLGRVEDIRAALAACVEGGAAPFSVLATNRWLLDTYRGDPGIDALLDRLHDGARPPDRHDGV